MDIHGTDALHLWAPACEPTCELGISIKRIKIKRLKSHGSPAMTDEELLEQLGTGGPRQTAALQRLYHGKGREFGRFFVSSGLTRQDADDVLQETVLKILQHATSFRGQGTVNSWMWQIARNCLIDHHRRQAGGERAMRELKEHALINTQPPQASSRKPAADAQWEHATNQESALQITGEPDPARLFEDCFEKGLARFKLEEPERAYAIALVVEEIDQREIAERIGRKYGATREYLFQCRQRLKPFTQHCLQLLSD